MSYCDKIDIIKLFNKRILFIDIETIGLPCQKGDGDTKPEEKFYNYKNNEKYENSRMMQISYYYDKYYGDNIPKLEEVKNYIIKPNNFKVSGTEFHKITEEIANKKGIKILDAINEIKNLILKDKIDYIVGYNPHFDINILMNELHRINYNKTLEKIEKMIKDKKIIDIAQICLKINIIKHKKKYQISKQSDIYIKLFNEEQKNSHDSQYDVLNLIKITNNIYNKIFLHCKKEYDKELLNYIEYYFKNNYFDLEEQKYEKNNNIILDNKLHIYDNYLIYPEKIKIKDALKIYYGQEYNENDYKIFQQIKESYSISLFPHYNLVYKQISFFGSEMMTELIDIENEEINLNFFENVILKNEYTIRVKLNNIYILDYEDENDYNIINIFEHIYNIGNYEYTHNIVNKFEFQYVINYDKQKLKEQIEELNLKQMQHKYDEESDRENNEENKNKIKNKINNKIKLKILGYNLFYGESQEQIKFINENYYDILFLSESSENAINSFKNYKGYNIKSHCGYTYLGINKKIKIDELKLIEMQGVIIIHLRINNKEIILGSIHLAPFKENIKTRNKQLNIIMNELTKLNLINIPIILGGDTNMRHEENVDEFDLTDVYLIKKENKYLTTYPNRNFKDEKLKFTPKNDFRYDRFFIKNCDHRDFKTIENNSSDHLGIEMCIEF